MTCTSREKPVSVLDDGLDYANNLQGQRGHHLCHVPAKNGWKKLRKHGAKERRSHVKQVNAYGSVWVQSKLGPRTMAMLLGVILLASWYSLSLAKNLIRYLRDRERNQRLCLCRDRSCGAHLKLFKLSVGSFSQVAISACSLLSMSWTLGNQNWLNRSCSAFPK